MEDEQPRDHLSRLIHEHRTRGRLGFSKLAKLAKEAGDPTISASWIQRLEKGEVKDFPTPERLAALAEALGLPDAQELTEAAVEQFYGYKTITSDDGSMATYMPGWDRLTDEEKRHIRELVALFARRRE